MFWIISRLHYLILLASCKFPRLVPQWAAQDLLVELFRYSRQDWNQKCASQTYLWLGSAGVAQAAWDGDFRHGCCGGSRNPFDVYLFRCACDFEVPYAEYEANEEQEALEAEAEFQMWMDESKRYNDESKRYIEEAAWAGESNC